MEVNDKMPIDIAKTLSPRRGKTSAMATSDKKNIVLSQGEIFIEYPNTGLGSSGIYRIKVGDGTTTYENLPDAFISDISDCDVTFSADTSTDVTTALSHVTTGASLATIVAGLKQAAQLMQNRVYYPASVSSSGISAKTLVGKSSTGNYVSLAQNVTIDTKYPILYSETAVTSGSTNANALLIAAADISGTKTFSDSGSILYAKGLLNGVLFTINDITTTAPSTEDGYEYLMLGITSGSNTLVITPNHEIFKYTNGVFARYCDIGDYGSEDPLSN